MPPLTNRLRAYPIRQVVQPLGSIADCRLTQNIFYYALELTNEMGMVQEYGIKFKMKKLANVQGGDASYLQQSIEHLAFGLRNMSRWHLPEWETQKDLSYGKFV